MNETLKTIADLRSVHGDFSEKEISAQDLQTILDSAVRAANASARQSYSIIVVEDSDMMKKLCGYTGSKLLLFCVDYNRIIDMAQHLGNEFETNGIVSFITGSTDTVLAAQTAAIAAKSLGIDSLFTNGIHRGDPQRVYELLDIPSENCFPLIALVLGYPREEPEYQKGRITTGVIHFDKYSRLTPGEMEQLVKEYDDPSRHLMLTEDWRQEFEHYLNWFYTKWSGKGDTQHIYRVLGETGFLDTSITEQGSVTHRKGTK
ncbi:MAG: nitroreductase family protein [Candidatus Fermentibacteraceae bacterium]|nr:nitroreductase family protein [Candidatus Fermentibacteraceae bacterium]